MARPPKDGLDYFELDCHMNEKIRLIQAEYGLRGFAIVVKLYQKIYGELGYYCEWSKNSSLLFASENGVSSRDGKNLINEIVAACIRRDIFSEEIYNKYHVLTSKEIQENYFRATARRDFANLKKEYLLVNVPENTVYVDKNPVNVSKNPVNVCNNPQIREEKNREEKRRIEENISPPLSPSSEGGANETAEETEPTAKAKPESTKEIPRYYENDALNEAFAEFVKMRKAIKKPMTDHAIDLAKRQLLRLTVIPFTDDEMDVDLAIKIIDQSVLNCWQKFYALKEDNEQKKPAKDSNGTNALLEKWRNA